MRERITPTLRALDEEPAADPAPPPGDYDLNRRPAIAPALRPAAVLVPLVEHPDGLTVLLTERSAHLNDHAGQISFPGGRIEPSDRTAVHAALREAHEEVGLEAHFVDVAGLLDDYETGTGFLVTPVVSFVRPGFTLVLDAFEVADAFEVPLEFLLDPANHRIDSRMRNGEPRYYHVFEYRDRYIWGATAGILMNLCRRLAGRPR